MVQMTKCNNEQSELDNPPSEPSQKKVTSRLDPERAAKTSGFENEILKVSDFGAASRAGHDGGVVIETRELTVQGNIVSVGARARYECQLDRLLEKEMIAPELYDAGIWLRSLYLRSHHSDGVSRYGDLGFDRDGGRSSHGPEMSDELAWNLRALRDTMLSLKAHWPCLRRLCCDDRMPGSRRAIVDALQALAKLRGFV